MLNTGGQGQVSKRKRVKGKIGDPNDKPELKFCSCIDNGATVTYGNVYIPGVHGTSTLDARSSNSPQVWRPYWLQWPQEGTDFDERVGRRIKVKYLRIKGYATSSPYLIDQVRWRLVLYRTKRNFITVAGSLVEGYPMEWVYDLYRKTYNLEDATTSEAQLAAVNMYYMSFFNPLNMKDNDTKRRILMKGMFNPQSDIGNYKVPQHAITGSSGAGTAAMSVAGYTATGYMQRHFGGVDIGHVANMNASFPIDLTVTLNDNVDCSEYRYVLMIETDCIIGQTPLGEFDRDPSNANYIFSLVAQIYYTDD